jgi:hypothetical protein
MSHAGVIGTENDYAVRDFEARVHGSGHVAGVHVSGVRGNATDGGDTARFFSRCVFLNRLAEFFSAAGIELTRDGRRSYGGSHERPPDFGSQFPVLCSQ